MSGRLRRGRARLGRLGTPEVLLGALVTGGWAAAAAFAVTGAGLTAVTGAAMFGAVAVALWLHLAAVDTGHHGLSWMSTGVTLLCIVLALARRGTGPLPFTAAGVTALAHNELIRYSYTRRRRAVVSRAVPRVAAAGLAIAGALALAGTWLAVLVSGDAGQRSWLWMPATVGALVLATVVLTVAPVRRAPLPSRDRWRPGDRIPPPPPPNQPAGPEAAARQATDLFAPADTPTRRPVGDRRVGR